MRFTPIWVRTGLLIQTAKNNYAKPKFERHYYTLSNHTIDSCFHKIYQKLSWICFDVAFVAEI